MTLNFKRCPSCVTSIYVRNFGFRLREGTIQLCIIAMFWNRTYPPKSIFWNRTCYRIIRIGTTWLVDGRVCKTIKILNVSDLYVAPSSTVWQLAISTVCPSSHCLAAGYSYGMPAQPPSGSWLYSYGMPHQPPSGSWLQIRCGSYLTRDD